MIVIHRVINPSARLDDRGTKVWLFYMSIYYLRFLIGETSDTFTNAIHPVNNSDSIHVSLKNTIKLNSFLIHAIVLNILRSLHMYIV